MPHRLAALQITIAELVKNFEFGPASTSEGDEIKIQPCVATTLMPANENGEPSLVLDVKPL
jgi:hypothetical protein